jgi:hypothetical protein
MREKPQIRSSSKPISSFLTLFLVQITGSFLATSPVVGFTRPAVLLVALPLLTMLACLSQPLRARHGMWIALSATLTTLASMHVLRQRFDATWFLGPAPAEVQLVGYVVLASISVACAACVRCLFAETSRAYKGRWWVVGTITVTLAGLGVLARSSVWEPSPSGLLRTITILEQQPNADPAIQQQLSVMLAACGRETEAEGANRWQVTGGPSDLPRPSTARLDLSKYHALPWRETMVEVARRERLIVIMEAHNAPKHRQWIEQVLPILREAGFRDYAAEGLSEPGQSLKQRGYPVASTGVYVSDPHFGNILRTALRLGFDLHPYEAHGKDYRDREREQAANLARLFAQDPNLKLVVHAGYAHVLKRPLETGEKMMAAYLWEFTGIEPYCILQTWHSPEEPEARQLAELVKGQRPILLAPAPSGLRTPQFAYPAGSVDAVVVHAPSAGGPEQRAHEFTAARERIAGEWNGGEWPVLIGAFKKGEPADAIALDQVMLRSSERRFVLWVPGGEHDLRAYGTKGPIRSREPNGLWKLELESR